MNSDGIVQNLLQSISIIADQKVKKAGYDTTIQAIIISCEDPSIGKYKVQYQDGYWYAYSSSPDIKYSEGSSVYILIPGNNMSSQKTIIGTVDKTEVSNIIDFQTSIIPIGNNILLMNSPTTEYGLKSYLQTDERVLYEDGETSVINIDEDAETFYLKESEYLLLKMDVRTALPNEQRYQGNYGIECTLVFNNPDDQKSQIEKTYIFDTNKIQGNPYMFQNKTTQQYYFKMDGKNFVKVKKIKIFSNNFPNHSQSSTADIFLSNFYLGGMNLLTSDQIKEQFIYLNAPKGLIFNSSSDDSEERDIIANVFIKGQKVNNNQLDCYWFVQNAAIIYSSDGYNRYGGQGWKCLNSKIQKTDIDSNPQIQQYAPMSAVFTITKQQVKSAELRIKCVAIYNKKIILMKETMLKNLDSEYSLTIDCSKTQFKTAKEQTTLKPILKRNGIQIVSNVNFIWMKKDPNGIISNDIEVVNNQVTVQSKDIDSFAIFIVSAIDTETGSLIASQRITIVNNYLQLQYFLNIVNGTQIFKYDAYGVSPASSSKQNPLQIAALQFELYNNTGQKITEGITNQSWHVPLHDQSMIEADQQGGTSVQDGTVFNTNTLIYKIDNFYNFNKNNNIITLSIQYDGNRISASTDFTFLKQGENGTNGTRYMIRLVPQYNNEIKQLIQSRGTDDIDFSFVNYSASSTSTYSIKEFFDNNIPFKVELWDMGQKIFQGNSSNAELQIDISWSLLRNKYSSDRTDDYYLYNINENTGAISYKAGWTTAKIIAQKTNYNFAADLIQATVRYQGLTYYATGSFLISFFDSSNNSTSYIVGLKKKTGFKTVLFDDNGKYPAYNTVPFEIAVFKKNNNQWEQKDNIYFSDNDGVVTQGSIMEYTNGSYNYVPIKYLECKNIIEQQRKAQIVVKQGYDGFSVNQGLMFTLSDSGTNFYFHIPIHLMLNRYSHENLNGWNGNSIEINQDEGYILSPQVGAGQKQRDNSFTGLLMGKIKNSSREDVGLFGYKSGNRTIFLDAKTGKAQFGQQGKGQIRIDPSSDQAIIESGNYQSSIGTSVGAGMQINLTTPQIKFGTGKFEVDYNGNLHAQNVDISGTIEAEAGGTIGGMSIDTYGLTSDYVHIGTDGIWVKDTSVSPSVTYFSADSNGAFFKGTIKASTGGTIGPLDIAADGLTGIFTDSQMNNYRVHFGTDGFSAGSNFSVSSTGTLICSGATIQGNSTVTGTINAGTGRIGDATNGFTITSNGLYKGALGQSNSVYLSSKGSTQPASIGGSGNRTGWVITAGSNFGVASDGSLYCTGATISGAITATSLDLGTNKISTANINGLSSVATSGNYSDLSGKPDLTVYIAKDGTVGLDPDEGVTGFKVSNAGVLRASNAVIFGTIYASEGKVGGWIIKSNKLYTGSNTPSEAGAGYITLSTADFTRSINNVSRTNLRFAIGSNFAVSNTGIVYANSAYLYSATVTGTITAGNGSKIGNWTISSGQITDGTKLWRKSEQAGVYIGTDGIGIGASDQDIPSVNSYFNGKAPDPSAQDNSYFITAFEVTSKGDIIQRFFKDSSTWIRLWFSTSGIKYLKKQYGSGSLASSSWTFYDPFDYCLSISPGGKIRWEEGVIASDSSLISSQRLHLSPGIIVSGSVSDIFTSSLYSSYNSIFGGKVYFENLTATSIKIDRAVEDQNATPIGLRSSDSKIVKISSSSSIRYKQVLRDMSSIDIQKAYSIQPVIAKYKEGYLSKQSQSYQKYLPMFIAEDVQKYIPEAVYHNEDGLTQNWRERIMIPVMFQMIKDLKSEIQELKRRLN